MLIGRGANVDARDVWGKTPIHQAAYNGHLEVARLLIAKKCNASVISNEGARPQLLAKLNRYKGSLPAP